MRQRDLLTKKIGIIYNRRAKKNKMRLQVDQNFQKNDVKELNKKFNVDMFSTKIRGGKRKAFAVEKEIEN